MKQTEKALKQYYRRISRWLPCSGKLKKQILRDIRQTIGGYLQENPEASIDDIVHHYGTPQQIAVSYTDEMDTSRLLHNLRINRRIFRAVAVTCLLLIAMWAATVTAIYIKAANSVNGYIDPGYISVIEQEALK